MPPTSTTSTPPCMPKSNSFMISSSRILALNGRHHCAPHPLYAICDDDRRQLLRRGRCVQRTLLFRDSPLVLINVLEYITVIINYIVALHVLRTTNITDDPHPVLLNIADNSSALLWMLHTCKRSKVGRLLGRFFCSFLINSPLGINSQ